MRIAHDEPNATRRFMGATGHVAPFASAGARFPDPDPSRSLVYLAREHTKLPWPTRAMLRTTADEEEGSQNERPPESRIGRGGGDICPRCGRWGRRRVLRPIDGRRRCCGDRRFRLEHIEREHDGWNDRRVDDRSLDGNRESEWE